MAINPNALTDAATIQARLRIAAGTDQALIEQLINEASDAIEKLTQRKLSYLDVVTESLPLMGGPRLLLSRTPLVAVASITRNGELVDPTEYAIDDANAGQVYRDRGWPWSAQLRPDLNFQLDQQPGTEKKNNTVAVYSGGYVTGVQVAAANTPGWVTGAQAYGKLIRPGAHPTQVWEATTAGAAAGVEPAWPASPVVGQTIVDGGAVWTFTGILPAVGLARTLPSDLERAALLATVAWYRGDGRNKNIKQETVGKASRTYLQGDLPAEVVELAMRYARWAA